MPQNSPTSLVTCVGTSVGASLAEVRIVSVAQNLPGPLALARLVGLGATAVKVEPPAGDPFREMSRSWYDEMHVGVTVERLDLKSAAGRLRLGVLLGNADLLITSQRPSALARLGLDSASLIREAGGLRLLRIVGAVSDPETPGHDLTYQARAGLLRDQMPVSLFADVMAAERAFAAALLLLRDAPGAVGDVGIAESVALLYEPIRHGLTTPSGVLGGALPHYGVYTTKAGRIAIAALEPHFERRLYEALSLAPKADLGERLTERTASEWEEWARQRDLPMTAVL